MDKRNEQHDEQRVVYESSWEDETGAQPVYAVVSAVSDVEECNAMELPPLHESIDTDALNRLILPNTDTGADQIIFHYCGYKICVRDAEIQLQPSAAQSVS